MNIQEFINTMTSNWTARRSDYSTDLLNLHTNPQQWFSKARAIEIIEDNDKFGVYAVSHDIHFGKATKTLAIIDKINKDDISIPVEILIKSKGTSGTLIPRDCIEAAIDDFVFCCMVRCFYTGHAVQAMLGMRDYTEAEKIMQDALEIAYQYLVSKHLEIYKTKQTIEWKGTFLEYFKSKSRFTKKNLNLTLDSGLKLNVERIRWVKWSDKEIVSRFTFNVHGGLTTPYKKIAQGKALGIQSFTFEVCDSEGKVTSHNQLYKTFPDFKKKIDAIFS